MQRVQGLLPDFLLSRRADTAIKKGVLGYRKKQRSEPFYSDSVPATHAIQWRTKRALTPKNEKSF